MKLIQYNDANGSDVKIKVGYTHATAMFKIVLNDNETAEIPIGRSELLQTSSDGSFFHSTVSSKPGSERLRIKYKVGETGIALDGGELSALLSTADCQDLAARMDDEIDPLKPKGGPTDPLGETGPRR